MEQWHKQWETTLIALLNKYDVPHLKTTFSITDETAEMRGGWWKSYLQSGQILEVTPSDKVFDKLRLIAKDVDYFPIVVGTIGSCEDELNYTKAIVGQLVEKEIISSSGVLLKGLESNQPLILLKLDKGKNLPVEIINSKTLDLKLKGAKQRSLFNCNDDVTALILIIVFLIFLGFSFLRS